MGLGATSLGSSGKAREDARASYPRAAIRRVGAPQRELGGRAKLNGSRKMLSAPTLFRVERDFGPAVFPFQRAAIPRHLPHKLAPFRSIHSTA